MATEFWRRDTGGTWRKAVEVHRRDSGGTWRKAKEIWRKDTGGTWRLIFSGENFNLTFTNASNIRISPTDASAFITLVTDGTSLRSAAVTGGSIANGNWWSDTTPPTVHVRVTVTSGSLTSGTTGTWLSIGSGGSNRTWTVTRTTIGTNSATVTFDFSLDGGTTTHATKSGVTITATEDA
jgi:hypothetical protein